MVNNWEAPWLSIPGSEFLMRLPSRCWLQLPTSEVTWGWRIHFQGVPLWPSSLWKLLAGSSVFMWYSSRSPWMSAHHGGQFPLEKGNRNKGGKGGRRERRRREERNTQRHTYTQRTWPSEAWTLYDLAFRVTLHIQLHTVFISSKALSLVHIRGERNELPPFEGKNVKGLRDMYWKHH